MSDKIMFGCLYKSSQCQAFSSNRTVFLTGSSISILGRTFSPGWGCLPQIAGLAPSYAIAAAPPIQGWAEGEAISNIKINTKNL